MDEPKSRPPIKARRQAEGKFARAHARLELRIELTLDVLIPEDGFEPYRLQAFTSDVSAGGMGIVIEALSTALYAKLLSKTRKGLVRFVHPTTGAEISLKCQIAWIDYHKPKVSEGSGLCRLGVKFGEAAGASLETYREFVGHIEAA